MFYGKGMDFQNRKKRYKIPYRLFYWFENSYSFLDLIMWVLKITYPIFSILWKKFPSDFQYLQKQCKNFRSATAAAQSKCVVYFICLMGCFWLFLWWLDATKGLGMIRFSIIKECSTELLWHLGHRENKYFLFSGK